MRDRAVMAGLGADDDPVRKLACDNGGWRTSSTGMLLWCEYSRSKVTRRDRAEQEFQPET